MKKKTVLIITFVAVLVFGMGMVETTVSALSGGQCLCFNEVQAENNCESVCQQYTSTGCWAAGPAAMGQCKNGDCVTKYSMHCLDGSTFIDYLNWPNCEDCI